jgi:hypothetical protein
MGILRGKIVGVIYTLNILPNGWSVKKIKELDEV